MSHSLYIFVTSERPDQYLNPIVHCLLYKSVGKVVFLHIKGLGSSSSSGIQEQKGISFAVFRKVQVLLDGLANGEYKHLHGKETGKIVSLSEVYQQERLTAIKGVYRQCLDIDVNWSHRDVGYLDLRSELARIRKEEPTSIFDVTAISKSYLGDILAASIIEGIQNLYTFDLKQPPDFDRPWTTLFHDLHSDTSDKHQYQYVNIVDTTIFRECSNSILVRTPPLKISVVAAVSLLLITLVVYALSGEVNWFIQVTFIASAVTSFLSLYFNFFPPRR